ncbi:MAG TPA: hypothetical protein VGF18_08855, partial [Candidatus Tumulicola sp.]
FRRLQSYPVPPYAVWTTTWHTTAHPMGYYTGETTSVESHRYAVRLADGMENVSDRPANGKLPPALILPEFLGPFAWRLRTAVRPPSTLDRQIDMQPDVAGLATIAHVVAVAKPVYTIGRNALLPLPQETIGGRAVYRVRLTPLDHPQQHNLRDLWIDVQTHDIVRAHFVGTYAPVPKAPVSDTDVTVSFREVLGCWVVTEAIWTYDDPPVSYKFDVINDELALPRQLPDWLFDAAAYRARETAGDPDYLGLLLDTMRHGP